jgi:hypothetical protein
MYRDHVDRRPLLARRGMPACYRRGECFSNKNCVRSV